VPSARGIACGPFAETKEQIVGFDVLECADLDEAIEAAAKHPMARAAIAEKAAALVGTGPERRFLNARLAAARSQRT
jgi:hypothetical protein